MAGVTGVEPCNDVSNILWNYGRVGEPPLQVVWVDGQTCILRQSKRITYEAPFLYLLFGHDRAILWDTGAVRDEALCPLRSTVDGLISRWTAENPHREPYELVVAHTHAHGDHVAGDDQFQGRPDTVVVAHAPEAVAAFFGLSHWPHGRATFQLGGRALTLLPIPGHHPASIAVYDPVSQFLLTGDTVYPGRLYVRDSGAFEDSLKRLAAFVEEVSVRFVMGCHIEMTRTPGRDYPIGALYQPREAPLPLGPDDVKRVAAAARDTVNRPGVYRQDRFIIFQGQPKAALGFHIVRALCWNGWTLRLRKAPPGD